jgi:hypothetical protein
MDLDVAFKDPADRDAARNLMELSERLTPDGNGSGAIERDAERQHARHSDGKEDDHDHDGPAHDGAVLHGVGLAASARRGHAQAPHSGPSSSG